METWKTIMTIIAIIFVAPIFIMVFFSPIVALIKYIMELFD